MAPGAGNGTHRLSLGHLRTTRGAPEAPRRAKAQAHSRAEAATAAALPGAGRGPRTRPAGPQRGPASEKRSLRQEDPTERGRGRIPHPPPSTHYRQAGKRDEGPTGRTRRAVPFAMNVRPSPGAALARPRRARSHHIDRLRRRKGGDNPGSRLAGEDRFHPGACFGLTSPAPQGERQTTQNGERLTRGTEPWKRVSSQSPSAVPTAGSARW